ncbi:unnamed protein product [Aphanomyces euteiches]|uniref:Tudor domain-containing protein n=1 Tax=Aphanomyces euteiches TaxID=100861 RepID=A0A6G0X5J3_9STRA|nr:hypothetical protein Ae201684_008174 [Aphanomyces euteiches]KAH9151073.1 hypothetical protein AeRB84_006233 [Aphanomyces euteiches]
MTEAALDELVVHLRSDHGIQILVSLATKPSDGDVDLQANALRLLSESTDLSKVAKAWRDCNILDYLIKSEALIDPENDLHVPFWRSLCQIAETGVAFQPELWSRRRQLYDAAITLRDVSSLQSTSLVAHTFAALVCSVAEQEPSSFAPFSSSPFHDLVDPESGLAFCELVKQWYVLTNEAALLTMVGHLISSVDDVKAVYASGLVRLVCHDYGLHRENFEFYHGCLFLLCKIESVLFPRQSSVNGYDRFCHVVLHLALCKLKAVWSEMSRVIEHLVQDLDFGSQFIKEPHFRGVIAYFAAKQASDLTLWAEEIDALEYRSGSLISLPTLQANLSLKDALATASALKESGNNWFVAGNHTAARSFYRLALSTLAVAEANGCRQAPSSPLSIGQTVKVQMVGGGWLHGMVSDSNDNGSVDVVFDDDSEQDNIPLHRVRPVAAELGVINDLRLQLCMNSAKSLHGLKQTREAIECLAYALDRFPNDVPALYLRGVLSLAVHDTKQAKEDLQRAHQVVAKTKQHLALAGDIRTAWSRLQLVVKHRKRADKKLIKEMMTYLNTIVE